MPRRDRGPSAYARVDGELAEWASRSGWRISAGQVARWRRAGLLPPPTVPSQRPTGSPPGRVPLVYNDEDLRQAEQLIPFLAQNARRGRPVEDLAVLAFAFGYNAPINLVRQGLTAHLNMIEAIVDGVKVFANGQVAPVAGPDPFDVAEALAGGTAGRRSRPRHQRAVQKLDENPNSLTGLSVTIAMIQLVLGDASPTDELDIVEVILHERGAHGIVEAPPYDHTDAVTNTAQVASLFASTVNDDPFRLPDDITDDELRYARELMTTLTGALAAIPVPELRHHLAADAIGIWPPSNPTIIALTLNVLVKAGRRATLDPVPLVQAIQAQSWSSNPS